MLPNTVDFETKGIESRPDYPPVPVGVSIYEVGRKPVYLSWGHPTENNCTEVDAKRILKKVYNDKRPILFHNAKFDLDVGNIHLKLPLIPRGGYLDTMFEAYLHNPHEDSLSLKPLADKLLGMPPDEQNEIRDWIFKNVPECKGKKKNWKGWGAYIWKLPGTLSGKYAIGDTVRTRKLHDFLHPQILAAGMGPAYERELKVMPVLLDMERQGITVAARRLYRDTRNAGIALDAFDAWIRRRLKAPGLSVDSGEELADAIEDAGKVEEWYYTEGGVRSTSKENLVECVLDKLLVNVLLFRGTLAFNLRTFMLPWSAQAKATGGRIHTNWNQVRQPDERRNGGTKGARTGRISSNPNFQNIPNPSELNKYQLPKLLYEMMLEFFGKQLMPYMRSYIVPDSKEDIIVKRDYSQQELRILAHHENGALCRAYNENPRMDMHTHVGAEINALLDSDYGRGPIKTTNFGLIYGMGLDSLADQMHADRATAKQLRDAHRALFPDVKAHDDFLKAQRECITWGGRVFPIEPPKRLKDGRLMTFDYKLLNAEIQGGAADNTKQAMINYYDHPKRKGRLLLTVHDELVSNVHSKWAAKETKVMDECMQDVDFRVPMLSDGFMSSRSWGAMKK